MPTAATIMGAITLTFATSELTERAAPNAAVANIEPQYDS